MRKSFTEQVAGEKKKVRVAAAEIRIVQEYHAGETSPKGSSKKPTA